MKFRKLYNKSIIEKLQELVEKHPDLRFGQILMCSGVLNSAVTPNGSVLVDDPFFEEPKDTWERMINNKFAFDELDN